MIPRVVLFVIFLLAFEHNVVNAAKQQVQLSDSYLPVAMQVIAHLTDQMAYEAKDEPTQPTKGTQPTTSRPSWATKPTKKPTLTTSRPTTATYVTLGYPSFWQGNNGWQLIYGARLDVTTPIHKPGLYAPALPPKPSDRLHSKIAQGFVLLPFDHNSQYTVIEPQEKRTEEPLLSIHNEEVKPLVDPTPGTHHLLPPHFDPTAQVSSRSDGFDIDELSEENLQYLSPNLRDMIKMANDPDDDRVIDVWEGARAGQESGTKPKLSSSNLRLLLLYDLLSREAKRQRLSDYGGFSPDVMKNLVESSNGGARAQLRFALSKMVDRRDSQHEYANNRAKEMVQELAKDESKLSAELRYLQPLVYNH